MHARLDRGKVQLLTRTGRDWTLKFRVVSGAFAMLPAETAYFDGELCGVLADGRTAFNLIQNATDGGNADALVFFLFDLLYLDGRSLVDRPLLEPKAMLQRLLRNTPERLRYSDHQSATVRRSSLKLATCKLRASSRSGSMRATPAAIAVSG
jgi:bifunctional non-homologous end joining protein LigD